MDASDNFFALFSRVLRSKLDEKTCDYVCKVVREKVANPKAYLTPIDLNYLGLLTGAEQLPNLDGAQAYWTTVNIPYPLSEKYASIAVYIAVKKDGYNQEDVQVFKYKLNKR